VLGDGFARLGGPGFREKAAQKSVVTSMAGFAGARRPHPGRHTTAPAAFRYALAVSRRTPVASSMRRKDHPSFPNAITCCFFSSLKTLLMPREPIRAPIGVNVPGFAMAGFQVTLHGRIWVTAEGASIATLQNIYTLNKTLTTSLNWTRPFPTGKASTATDVPWHQTCIRWV
jgi:hypothetical protein